MELIVLKVPPERVALIADALQFCIEDGKYLDRERELTEILVWLRYRHGKYLASRSVAEARKQKPPRAPRR